MRRPFINFTIACTLLAGGCSADMTGPATSGRQLELVLSLDDSASRILFADGKYAWEGGESLGAYVTSALPTVNAEASVEVRGGDGYCSLTTAGEYADGDMLYAYHPYAADNNSNTLHGLRLEIPEVQKQAMAGKFNLNNMPMVSDGVALTAADRSQSVTMRPLGGFLRLNVYASGQYAGEKVQGIVFDGGKNAAGGSFSVDMAGEDALTVAGLSATQLSVELENPYTVGSTQGAAESIYLVVAPAAYTATLTILTDVARYTYVYNRTVSRNTYNTVNINLSNATDRTPTVHQEPIVATLTYAEAKDAVEGSYTKVMYTNSFGEWEILASDQNAMQINNKKSAHITSPVFSGKVTSVVIETSESYSGSIYISPIYSSPVTPVVTASGGGLTTTISLADADLNQICITSSAVCKIMKITIAVNGATEPNEPGKSEPTFSGLSAETTNTSATDAADGTATLSATVAFQSDTNSIVSTGFCWKRSTESEFAYMDLGTALSLSAPLSGLSAGTYTFYAYATLDDGTTYESERASFTVGNDSTTVTPDSGYKYGWLELPATNMAHANASEHYYSVGADRNYTAFYDKDTYSSLWVAYPLAKGHMGTGSSSGWTPAPDIPESDQINVWTSSYGVNYTDNPQNIYSRGHQIANADRKGISAMQKQTYYAINSTPQIQNDFNGHIWSSLESAIRNAVPANDSLYVATGPVYKTVGGSEEVKWIQPKNDSKQCPVPNYYFKVVLKVKRSGAVVTDAMAVGFWFVHTTYPDKDSYPDQACTVDEIERKTGFDFFANLPDAIESKAEANGSWSTFTSW